jgi:hypothetical protein
MTTLRIQELESLEFRWDSGLGRPFEASLRLSQIHGHCNVPTNYSENIKLGSWVEKAKGQLQVHPKERHRS